MHACQSHFSHVQLFATQWTVAHQAPEYWSKLPHPPPEDLPDPGIKPMSLKSALAGSLPLAPPERPGNILGSKDILADVVE